MKVVWLASWYPNRTAPFNGDFIQRHAIAAAPFVSQLFVIAIIKDDAMESGSTEIIKSKEGNLIVYTVYYGRGKIGAAEKLLSFRKYFSLQKKIFKQIESGYGRPDLVHVHVPMKAGLFALYLKQKMGIPYLVTEHWAGYAKICRPNIYDFGKTFTRLNNLVLKGAALVLPVSNYLGKLINDDFVKIKYTVIPNVVDTGIFYPFETKQGLPLRLIHVSTMGYQKNMEAVVRALALWKGGGGNFELNCYGKPNESLEKLVKEGNLEQYIHFYGEVQQQELAIAMQHSNALILYSRYETFGCVLVEANACGIPVIVSNLEVFGELVTEKVNGIIVEGDNPAALAEAFASFAATKNNFNKAQIAAQAKERFGFDTVGKQIREVYDATVNSRV